MNRILHSAYSKLEYEPPKMEIVHFSCEDIITSSGDYVEGEWDPQMDE